MSSVFGRNNITQAHTVDAAKNTLLVMFKNII